MKNSKVNSTEVPINVVVVGSINCDLTTYVTNFPTINQTVMARNSILSVGGKGVNQAVAAAQDGAKVSFVGCVGDDAFGDSAIQYMHSHQINTDHVRRLESIPTGTASILVTDQHDNMIAVSPGANWQLTIEDVTKAESVIRNADVVIVQLEVPPAAVKTALELSRKYNVHSILNPAPAAGIATSLYSLADIITPNESEAAELTGTEVDDLEGIAQAAKIMLSEGVKQVVITLGERGSYIASKSIQTLIPPFPVDALDPTGAGDVFNGILAVGISRDIPLYKAVKRASAAAALSVTKALAQGAAPDSEEIDHFLQLNSD
jgi:ribokinase